MYELTHHIVSLPTSQYIQEYRNPEKFISFCQQCERYNRCWACPPFEFNTDEYLSGYQQTYIIGTKITLRCSRLIWPVMASWPAVTEATPLET